MMKIYWHDVNPWRNDVVYVPLHELAEALDNGTTIRDVDGKIVPHDAAYHLRRWHETSRIYGTPDQLDAYILPQPSGDHSCGVRYGSEGSQYFSPHNGAPAKVQALLDKYRTAVA